MWSGPRWGLGAQLWALALACLPLTALSAPVTTEAVVSLALGGGVLWAVALMGRRASRPEGEAAGAGRAGWLVAALALSAVAEGVGLIAAGAMGRLDQAAWLGVAAGFASAGVVTALRREPGPGVVVSQVAFQAVMIVPALSAQFDLARRTWAAGAPPGGPGAINPRDLIALIAASAAPPMLILLAAALLHELRRPPRERDLPWTALLDAQLAFSLLLLRWAYGQFG